MSQLVRLSGGPRDGEQFTVDFAANAIVYADEQFHEVKYRLASGGSPECLVYEFAGVAGEEQA